ncbi:MAG: hypothetical protein HC835_21750 [Oscillatoriales cyanobacterium RM2_1_1]|nr:hypothetical protein [Oscillatoriales cyanobacterium SM2_3_0]NJO48007.1 hypothetical protein [Oscillatoriales cyanobacterium RM2_1_1]
MGKPLGLGAVKIEYKLHLSDRKERYEKLFSDSSNDWEIAESLANPEQEKGWVAAFKKFILHEEIGISKNDHPYKGQASSLKEVPRIETLLAILRCD